MPPCLDVYVFSKSRNRQSLERFVQLWVDRDASEDRGDEKLMILPLAAAQPPSTLSQWDWETAGTLTRVLDRSLEHPRRAFAIYLKSKDPAIHQAILAFTNDDQVVFGLSVDDPIGSESQLDVAKRLLKAMSREFNAHSGYITCEEPPPLTTDVGSISYAHRALFTSSHDA